MPARVRVYLGCSLDHCIAGPDGELDWLHEPAPADAPAIEASAGLDFPTFLGQVGCLLMGRSTYAAVEAMGEWPYGEVPVLVATRRSLTPAAPTVRAVAGPIDELLAQARSVAGERDVYLDGGDVVRQALEADLVDELCLTLLPVVLGRGTRLFDGLTRRSNWRFGEPQTYGHMVQLTLTRR